MRSVTLFPTGIMVTGSSGFIGERLCRSLQAPGVAPRGQREASFHRLDVCNREDMRRLAGEHSAHTVVHLAAIGTVITARAKVSQLFREALDGAVNVLDLFGPRRLILASSCAIYGTTNPRGVSATWRNIHSTGHYGMSKAALEALVNIWAQESGNTGINLRLGNVVGVGCGGLIPYLVRHVVNHPDGAVHAAMRGNGKIVRDYVPIDYTLRIIEAAMNAKLRPGSTLTLNLGSGYRRTNGSIADMVRSAAARRGYRLVIDWAPTPGPGEALVSALDIAATTRRFKLEPPSEAEVLATIEETIERHFESAIQARLRSDAS